MNILLLGSGGREHAFALKIHGCIGLESLYISPGNPGTAEFGTNVTLDLTDFSAVYAFCKEKNISLVVPGNEGPLVAGITDYLTLEAKKDGFTLGVSGPSTWCAQLEGSKEFSKEFMFRHAIPTARYASFCQGQMDEAKLFLHTLTPPYVLKADGLAAGKGVVITHSFQEACETLESMTNLTLFGKAGARVVIEEFLQGIELSVFAISDGDTWQVLASAKDYKRIFDNDLGLNTGGMGAISPVPFADKAFMEKVKSRILIPSFEGLKAEGHPYTGFLFVGLMNVGGDPFVIEYNVRMGDPETEAIFPRLKTPLIDILYAMASRGLNTISIDLDSRTAASIFLVSGGYPGEICKGEVITLPRSLPEKDQWIFHASTTLEKGILKTNGGRVIAVTSLGKDIKHALERSNSLANQISFNNKFNRTDIGLDLLYFT
ncbi:MAG: phosphoribosylamine--glycine ligase [Flavobacteriaceae bacterium]|nr:phosphoribosylamine--glycine ligase [Flavobacteriaceae bacterium]